MPTKNAKPSVSVISLLLCGRLLQPTPPLYWRSRRELPTGLSAANQPREAHVHPRRSRRRVSLALSRAGRSTMAYRTGQPRRKGTGVLDNVPTSILPYILPSSVYSNSFVFTLFTKLPGWGCILPKLERLQCSTFKLSNVPTFLLLSYTRRIKFAQGLVYDHARTLRSGIQARSQRAQRRSRRQTQEIPMAIGHQLLPAAPGRRPRRDAIPLGPRRQQVSRLLRRHPHGLGRPLQSQSLRQGRRAGEPAAAHLHALSQ